MKKAHSIQIFDRHLCLGDLGGRTRAKIVPVVVCLFCCPLTLSLTMFFFSPLCVNKKSFGWANWKHLPAQQHEDQGKTKNVNDKTNDLMITRNIKNSNNCRKEYQSQRPEYIGNGIRPIIDGIVTDHNPSTLDKSVTRHGISNSKKKRRGNYNF